MNIALQTISYKDPAGFIIRKEGSYYRYVMQEYMAEFDHLMQSGLYKTLTDQNLLLPHQEIPGEYENKSYYKILLPQQIPLITYPFEWTYSQWQEMALTFIRINQIALQHGMILKDATPYNFVFNQGNCILLDTLSFRFFTNGEPWIAYHQFCEEILSPLALMRHNHPFWVRLYRSVLTGLPLSFVSRQLPFTTWFNSTCLLHIHWHAKFENKKEKSGTAVGGFSRKKLEILLDLLKDNISKWKQPLVKNSIWDQYYENDIKEQKYLADKTKTIIKWLSKINPFVTIDMGANTGKYSFIASLYSEQVVAVEMDMFCIEEILKKSKEKKIKNITTIVADITEPSPGLGWENTEKAALIKRLNADMLMGLALIHHLCISKNLPLSFIAKTLASITSKYAIIEFIPKEDSKVKQMLQYRKDIFKEYTEENFISCFQQYFKLVEVHACTASARKLYLWEKN